MNSMHEVGSLPQYLVGMRRVIGQYSCQSVSKLAPEALRAEKEKKKRGSLSLVFCFTLYPP
jgi:hypothetical protein